MRNILILAGPSAVGKTTVMKKMMELDGRFEFIRSATTRAPRGDGHDSEYIYDTVEGFLKRIEEGKMLEYMQYGDNYYGTPASEIERIFAMDKTPFLILDIVGVNSIKSVEREFKTVAVYVYDDLDVMAKRLYERELADNGNNEKARATYEKRISANIRDYKSLPECAHLFDAFVKNGDLTATAKEVLSELDRIAAGGEPKREKIAEIAKELALSAE